MQAKTLSVIISFLVLLVVIDLIRRQKMTFKYSLSWLSACVAIVIFSVHDRLLTAFARWAGFELPSNFVFFLLLVFFVFLSLLLTIYINEQNNRAEKLAQALGILEYRVKRLEHGGPR